jgi:hypothetical protein
MAMTTVDVNASDETPSNTTRGVEHDEGRIEPQSQEISEEDAKRNVAQDAEELMNPSQQLFSPGDHVYKWCSFAGFPGVFQHHGIVTEVDGDRLTIADFNHLIRGDSGSPPKKYLSVKKRRGNIQLCEQESSHEWRLVEYQASWWKRGLWRSGTCTAVASDPPGLVLSRVSYLLDHAEQLPDYHFLRANCECVAVWCKTGAWATLQASSFLHLTAAGQIKSASTLAAYAATQQVTVPAAGLWGYLGFTTKVSLLSTQPYLLPAIAGYGLVTVGGPIWMLARCKQAWNRTTEELNASFWENAIDQPDVFVECITEWSQL